MAHAEKCPVCQAKGTIPESGYASIIEIECYGCGGKGWVEVCDDTVSFGDDLVQEPVGMPRPFGG